MLRITTFTSGARLVICAVASMPLSSGMPMSRSAMSGPSSIACWTAARPSPASATTRQSG